MRREPKANVERYDGLRSQTEGVAIRHDPASGAIVIMLRRLKIHGMAQAVTDLIEQGAPAFEAAMPMLSQLLKAELAEREVRSIAYLPFSASGGALLFHLLSKLYERTSVTRTGLGTIRYAKGKPLNEDVGAYQSSVLFGCRKMIDVHDQTAPEEKFCLTLDCASGRFVPVPSDATRRFQNMEASCKTIAEWWDSIEQPEGEIF